MYRNGEGVPQDNAEAVKWFLKVVNKKTRVPRLIWV